MKERKKQRLLGFDYSTPGAYFVTICVQGIECRFGEVVDGSMALSEDGVTAQHCWLDLPNHYVNCRLDEFVIMPNHVHAIVIIGCGVGNMRNVDVGNGLDRSALSHSETRPFPTLSSIIGLYKSGV